MEADDPTRRSLLTGCFTAEQASSIHISSAVVSVLPKHCDRVARLLSEMPGVEVHHRSESKIVVVLEGPDSGVLGGRLAEIASFPGVLSANMVFEQIERISDLGE
ncbi:MAG: chaperone NapD [Pseudolabrys sp.]